MALEPDLTGWFPEVAPTAYVHPTATIIGRVYVGERVFIGPNAVLRADETGPDGTVEPIVIGDGANVQDCVVIHALGGTGVTIGPRTSIAHAAVIHGPCEIGAGCFVGFQSVVFRATLGDGALVMHKALVESAHVPAGFFVPSMAAICGPDGALLLSRAPRELVHFAERVARANLRLAEGVGVQG